MPGTDTDLSESLDSLRYLVAVPGGFASAFPDTDEQMLTQVLMDAFAEAQLMGVFTRHRIDEDGIVTPGLSPGEISLVTLFAGVRLMRSTLINTPMSVTYKAGSAEYSTTQSSSVLRDILADLIAQKKAILDLLATGGTTGGAQAFYMADQYLARVMGYGEAVAGW